MSDPRELMIRIYKARLQELTAENEELHKEACDYSLEVTKLKAENERLKKQCPDYATCIRTTEETAALEEENKQLKKRIEVLCHWSAGDILKLQEMVKSYRAILLKLVNSEAVKEAPLISYSEAYAEAKAILQESEK